MSRASCSSPHAISAPAAGTGGAGAEPLPPTLLQTQVRMLALICTAAVVLPLLAVCSFFAMEAQAQRVLMW